MPQVEETSTGSRKADSFCYGEDKVNSCLEMRFMEEKLVFEAVAKSTT